ncbi:hypothetical protein [Clavibacter michiganensis]|uniref:hypothetical protein n=1 Tax=Clavibacter michiganensis TaxID=28447 RepID=UPI000A385A9D|nr:hypothetical protein [Clavibacter michiganensis]MDO4099781.1 hypothetical protein [Clavibacter michiganensis]MDO4128589.1 hypothetical protein [Clavibacter michiganensis]NIY61274.1 hypothetical protein [Clavibacter michiganensis subsp. michiganensis]OUE11350.1 hypothetical protein CMMCA001_13695 [Clavibacter michiganensis subsp. michiganensis]QXP02292.1 hypothetical protein KN218_12025 [Clavibacter michiganensis subsp. michiganensis]
MSVIAAVAPARLGASTTAAPAVLDDVVVAGVSMRRLVEVCGTPCVHSGDAAGIREGGGEGGDEGGDGCGALVVVAVTAVLASPVGERVVCVDGHLDGVDARWAEARVLGRAVGGRSAARIVAAAPTSGTAVVALPDDLAVGDLVVVPCGGSPALHDVRLSGRPVGTGRVRGGRGAGERRVPPRRRRRH